MLFPEENPQRFSLWWNRRFENYTLEALLGYYIKSSVTDGGTGEQKCHLLVGCGTPGEDGPSRVTETTAHPAQVLGTSQAFSLPLALMFLILKAPGQHNVKGTDSHTQIV